MIFSIHDVELSVSIFSVGVALPFNENLLLHIDETDKPKSNTRCPCRGFLLVFVVCVLGYRFVVKYFVVCGKRR